MNLGAWIRAMQAVGLQASLDDLRDIVWLAGHVGDAVVPDAVAGEVVTAAPAPTAPPTAPPPPDAGVAAREARALAQLRGGATDDDEAPALYGAAVGDGSQRARRVQLRGMPALPNGLAIARALRPLSRRRPGRTLVLDESATAESIADTGLRAPVWRPARERWFDIVLAVEDMPSMAAWQPVVAAFERLLQRQGGFRSVTRLTLRTSGAQAQAQTPMQVWAQTPAGRRTPPRALHHRDGRRILLALSDGTSEAWHRGAMGTWLQQAAAELPVAVVQLLPPALWPNTAVGFAELRAWAPRLAAPSTRLQVRRPGWAEGEPGLVLPVLALEPAAVAAWARMVAAAGDAWTTAALLPLPDLDADASDIAATPTAEPDASARVVAFRASATSDAQRLAAYFSVVRPLTPPVMRVIHQAMAPASGAAALAQVFLGGLLKCVHNGNTPDEAAYDFHPGLRDQLQGGLTRQEFVQVNLSLHHFLQQESGTAFDFFALLEDRQGSERLPDAALPFVQMARSAARRFGAADVAAPAPPADPRAGVVAEMSITAQPDMLSFVHRSARGALTVRHPWPADADALLEAALAGSDAESMARLARAMLPRGLQDSRAYADGPPWAELVLDASTAPYPWELLLRSEQPERPPLAVLRGLTRRNTSFVLRPAVERARRALVIGEPKIADAIRQRLPGARREAERVSAALSRVLPAGAVQTFIGSDAEPVIEALRQLSTLRVLHVASHGDLLSSPSSPPTAAGRAARVRLVLGNGPGLSLKDLQAAGPMPEMVYLGSEHMADWAPQLLKQGAQVVVALAGLVDDEAAAVFAEVFYAVLEAGQSLLEATHQARAACHQRLPESDAWGRFQVWGDPAWRLVDDDAAPAAEQLAKGAAEAAAEPAAPAQAEPTASAETAREAHLPLPKLSDCRYLAYLSYAHADDDAWFQWVRQFGKELERSLGARMRGVRLPPLYVSGTDGPVAGSLDAALRDALGASFVFIVVVHDNYVDSAWCQRELEAFVARYGLEAALQRLYIVAMSEPAMQRLAGSAAWQRLFGRDPPVWMAFYDRADAARPLDIYVSAGIVSPAFQEPFVRLRDDLSDRLRADGGRRGAEAPAAPPPAPPPPPPPPPGDKVIFGFVPPASAAAVQTVERTLAQQGLPTRLLQQDIVFSDFAAFADASHLVLAFNDEPAQMLSLAPGGHLQLQRDAWLKQGYPADRLLWLDLRPTPPPRTAWRGAAAYVAQLGVPTLDAVALAARLRPERSQTPVVAVRVYIESNRTERTLWEALGQLLSRRWDALMQPLQLPMPLALLARGLPIEQIDSFPSLDDADGVVLLWGRKTPDLLVAQINKVEAKLRDDLQGTPGLVAYLSPPNTTTEPLPAWGWKVLRFDASNADAVTVVSEEEAQLDAFLRKVYERHARRTVPRELQVLSVVVASEVASAPLVRLLEVQIHQRSERWREMGRVVKLVTLELSADTLNPSHVNAITDCDVFVLPVLRARQQRQETVFDLAHAAFLRKGAPRVLVCSWDTDAVTSPPQPDGELLRKMEGLGVYVLRSDDPEHLAGQLIAQIQLIAAIDDSLPVKLQGVEPDPPNGVR